jgi:hypothetical protein
MEKPSKPEVQQQYVPSDIETALVQERPAGLVASWGKNLLTTVETRGIHRVTDEERRQNTNSVWHACTFWYAISSHEFSVINLQLGPVQTWLLLP